MICYCNIFFAHSLPGLRLNGVATEMASGIKTVHQKKNINMEEPSNQY